MGSLSSSPDLLPNLETFLGFSESLVPIRDRKTAQVSSVSFDGLLENPLLLKEDLKEGCGGQLWNAGMALAKYLLRQRRSDLFDKTMSVSPHSLVSTSISSMDRTAVALCAEEERSEEMEKKGFVANTSVKS